MVLLSAMRLEELTQGAHCQETARCKNLGGWECSAEAGGGGGPATVIITTLSAQAEVDVLLPGTLI